MRAWRWAATGQPQGVNLNTEDKIPFRAINSGLLQVIRWLILLACLCTGTFFLFDGTSVGSAVLLILVGLWFVLDNPLERFELLEGHCPSCDHEVKVRRLIRFLCPACRRTISIESDGFIDEHEEALSAQVLGETAAKVTQIEQVEISPGDTLDLHTFSPRDVASLLNEFIDLSQRADIRHVKVIHGKGTGTLRRRVRSILARDPRVVSLSDAPPESGGWGATVVELKQDLTPTTRTI